MYIGDFINVVIELSGAIWVLYLPDERRTSRSYVQRIQEYDFFVLSIVNNSSG